MSSINSNKGPKTTEPATVRQLIAFFGVILLSGAVAALTSFVVTVAISKHKTQIVKVFKSNQSILKQPSSTQIRDVINEISPSVVLVSASVPSGTSQGSGVAIGPNGLVLTSYHVIQNAFTITVTIPRQFTSYQATLVSYDSADDLALLQLIGAPALSPVSLADPNSIEVGESVLVIGYTLGLNGTPSVTNGIVSALGRSVQALSVESGRTENLTNVLQTDAAINPGVSGGPVVNMSGQLVGIAAAVAQPAQGQSVVEDIGFAIPVSTIKSVLPILEAHQNIVPPSVYLGVQVTDLTAQTKLFYGITVPISQGVLIEKVDPGSPAQLAGLNPGDVIAAVNSQPVSSVADFNRILSQFQPGQTITLDVYPIQYSGTVEKTYAITLAAPNQNQLPIGQ